MNSNIGRNNRCWWKGSNTSFCMAPSSLFSTVLYRELNGCWIYKTLIDMRNLIFSLLLLSGAAANAQSNLPQFERGDTTFYLLPSYSSSLKFLRGLESMDIGYIGEQVYTFSLHRATNMVYTIPLTNDWPNIGISYPRSHHTHKHEDYTKTQDYRDLQEWVEENKGKRYVIW